MTTPRVSGVSLRWTLTTSERSQSASRSGSASYPSAAARSSDAARPHASTCMPSAPSVAGDERADVPVADDPERAPVQLPADRRLPRPGAKRDGVGDDAAGRGEDQRERQLGRARTASPPPVQTTIPRRVHSVEVDVGHSAAGLADQPQAGEERQQRRVDRRALADQDERLGVADLRPRARRPSPGARSARPRRGPARSANASSRSTARW